MDILNTNVQIQTYTIRDVTKHSINWIYVNVAIQGIMYKLSHIAKMDILFELNSTNRENPYIAILGACDIVFALCLKYQ